MDVEVIESQLFQDVSVLVFAVVSSESEHSVDVWKPVTENNRKVHDVQIRLPDVDHEPISGRGVHIVLSPFVLIPREELSQWKQVWRNHFRFANQAGNGLLG